MSKIEVDAIEPQSGTALTVGASGDTITVPSGAILTTTNATVNLPATTTVSTELKTNKISPASGTAFTLGDPGDTFTVPAGATITNSGTATGFGGGKINQIVQTVKSDTFTSVSTTYADVTGMSVSITPSAASSKVLVMATLNVGNNTDDRWSAYQLVRDSTAISIGDTDGSKTRASAGSVRQTATGSQNLVSNMSVIFLDSPSTTSSTTYKLQCKVQSGGAVLTFNRPGNATNADYVVHTASSITAIEVLA